MDRRREQPTAVSKSLKTELCELARKASQQAYAPYSNYSVGAAVLMGDGEIFTGCNVENASYGLTNCAERTAVFSAISAGNRSGIRAVGIYVPGELAGPPCGACRQVINEFGPDAEIFSVCDGEDALVSRMEILLPGAFGPLNLASDRSGTEEEPAVLGG